MDVSRWRLFRSDLTHQQNQKRGEAPELLQAPITRVADATKSRARPPPSQRDHRPLMNDPG